MAAIKSFRCNPFVSFLFQLVGISIFDRWTLCMCVTLWTLYMWVCVVNYLTGFEVWLFLNLLIMILNFCEEFNFVYTIDFHSQNYVLYHNLYLLFVVEQINIFKAYISKWKLELHLKNENYLCQCRFFLFNGSLNKFSLFFYKIKTLFKI